MAGAKIVKMAEDNLDTEALREAGALLQSGGLVAFPTETVYGLGGNALDPEASKKIYAAKGRPFGQSSDRTYCRYGIPRAYCQGNPGKSG